MTRADQAVYLDDPQPIVGERDDRVVGLTPPRSGLRVAAHAAPETPIEKFIEPRIVVCRDVDQLSLVFARPRRRRGSAAIVVSGNARPRSHDIVGVIAKRAIADIVIDNYED